MLGLCNICLILVTLVMLATHPHLVLRLRMSRSYNPLPLVTYMAVAG
jgi:hypothetical protein